MGEQAAEIVDDRSFSRRVLASRRTTLVVLGSHGCLPCRFLARRLASLATALGGRVDILSCSVEASPCTARRYSVTRTPALFLFVNGGLLASRAGPAPVTEIRRWVADALEAHGGVDDTESEVAAGSFFRHLVSRPVVLRACAVASVVAPVLLLLNHAALVLSNPAGHSVLPKLALNFLVPYLVSSFSSARAATASVKHLPEAAH